MIEKEPTVTNIVPMYEFDESDGVTIPPGATHMVLTYPDGFVGYGYRAVESKETVLYKVEKA